MLFKIWIRHVPSLLETLQQVHIVLRLRENLLPMSYVLLHTCTHTPSCQVTTHNHDEYVSKTRYCNKSSWDYLSQCYSQVHKKKGPLVIICNMEVVH